MQRLSSKDLVTILDLSRGDIETIFETTRRQKPLAREHCLEHSHPNRTLACIFHKPSLRTRISFEIAIQQLGEQSLHHREGNRAGKPGVHRGRRARPEPLCRWDRDPHLRPRQR